MKDVVATILCIVGLLTMMGNLSMAEGPPVSATVAEYNCTRQMTYNMSQDSLQRLIYGVGDPLETSDVLAQCRSQAKLTDGELAITDQAGVYVVVTGEAILEVQCTRIQVRRAKH